MWEWIATRERKRHVSAIKSNPKGEALHLGEWGGGRLRDGQRPKETRSKNGGELQR